MSGLKIIARVSYYLTENNLVTYEVTPVDIRDIVASFECYYRSNFNNRYASTMCVPQTAIVFAVVDDYLAEYHSASYDVDIKKFSPDYPLREGDDTTTTWYSTANVEDVLAQLIANYIVCLRSKTRSFDTEKLIRDMSFFSYAKHYDLVKKLLWKMSIGNFEISKYCLVK